MHSEGLLRGSVLLYFPWELTVVKAATEALSAEEMSVLKSEFAEAGTPTWLHGGCAGNRTQKNKINQNQEIPVLAVVTKKGVQGGFWGDSNILCFYLGDGYLSVFTL